ncbi:hypothetical protein J2X63_003172 [Agromyces sp. 3263]|uniref:hypothetical protein n=1 Tax=Agromyces sp. 3263 TaxID=2817750 RepID=UPI00286587EB|nr:hypothetical protein [Agromyces sp. 3263]MDR6907464.1 hypothetical protein [Agromyces sp. 3263]
MLDVRDPQINPDYETVGWEDSTQYLNGGLGVSQSVAAHREYFLDFGMMSRAEARKITDFADGVYGTGLIYWLDPVAADQNALPQQWATPSIGGYDGVPLAGDVRPSLSTNSVTSQGYPSELATYTLAGDSVLRSVFVPIPTGYSAWVGVHGESDAAGCVKVTPYTGSTAGTVVHPTILSTATTTRVNTEVGGGATGLELSLDNTTPGTFTLAGMIVQVLRDGVTPATGGFVSGQGHSGCRFIGRPMRVPYDTSTLDLVNVTAKLGEVGEWV